MHGYDAPGYGEFECQQAAEKDSYALQPSRVLRLGSRVQLETLDSGLETNLGASRLRYFEQPANCFFQRPLVSWN